ncbi:hypothetical protein PUR49_08490 [Streptomyces sp. BE147]|uniref:hypothetical protein n=1 Tax=Streptomyces sp. BE147 TaxID=3002524 RepID=UPI002E799E57|nr:hypothetical protein [Streptomyces sp. BE147]MEE1736537.1 hypothetical protein [Streptomyces sp. BE147]
MGQGPDWFWDVLDATRPRLSALEAWLQAQPRRILEEFALAYLDAAESLTDFSEGVRVDGADWSEDSTEDLCLWVVGQGHRFWYAVITGEWELAEAAQVYLGCPSPLSGEVIRWDQVVSDPEHRGYQSPDAIVHGVCRTRFAEDLHERLSGG